MENKEELELPEMLEEAEEDVKNGRTSSVEEMFDEIRKKLNLEHIKSKMLKLHKKLAKEKTL